MEIMSFRDVDVNFSYETGKDDPLNRFYIPVLAESISYDRIAGFFTSSSLAVAARGIAGLIRNNGQMRIISCPRFDKNDIDIMNRVVNNPEEYLSNHLLSELVKIENEFQRDHLQALGWMLANGYLEMKIALVKGKNGEAIDYDSLFHQKIGIMTDKEGNRLSFSGSINETSSAWLTNIEEFKVFKSWEAGQDSYLEADIARFNEFWRGIRENVEIITLPRAVYDKILEIGKGFSQEHIVAKEYIDIREKSEIKNRLNLFAYQKDALEQWKENDFQLMFEMATGTGKTRTAIACMTRFMKMELAGLVIIACPQSTLSLQWKSEIEALGIEASAVIIADGSHKWREQLKKELNLLSLGFHKHAIVYTTHATASNEDFISIIDSNISKTQVCFIGDEAHGLGAFKTKNALLEKYRYRVGLSATPIRWFDEYGTQILKNYFGGNSFCFTIAQAQTTINPLTNKPFLVEFEYYPVFISLTDKEIETYQMLSSRIKKMASYSKDSDKYQSKLERLLYERANIEKNAELKYDALIQILNRQDVNNTLIFTSDVQIDETMCILEEKHIMAHRFTQEQKTTPNRKLGGKSERQYLIDKFKEGAYNVLVAIKCLDEGIDIPVAETAIIMASSTNPREYIQRIGRVIRQSKGKERAYIYDFTIEPDFARIKDPDLIEFEKYIFEKELVRIKDMSKNSINNADVLEKINSIIRRVNNGAK
jgi:superfamily II DNA or RNA helicase